MTAPLPDTQTSSEPVTQTLGYGIVVVNALITLLLTFVHITLAQTAALYGVVNPVAALALALVVRKHVVPVVGVRRMLATARQGALDDVNSLADATLPQNATVPVVPSLSGFPEAVAAAVAPEPPGELPS